MVVDSSEPITIVEQDHSVAAQVHDNSTEEAIELVYELTPKFFVQVHEVAGVIRAACMPFRGEVVYVGLVSVVLTGEDQADIMVLVPDGQAVGKGILVGDPAAVESEPIAGVRARDIELLVLHARDHRAQRIVPFRVQTLADDTSYSGHATLPCRFLAVERNP